MSRYPRLSLADRSNLRIERPETPAHVAGLCVVEAGPLLRQDGELDLATIRRRVDRRLSRVPELRRVVHRPPPFCGPPLWVDDPDFSIDRHVNAVPIAPPGDEASLLQAAELLLRPMLNRSRPLWELWFLIGLEGGRLGVLFKVHHALADGLAAISLVTSLLDPEPDAADPPEAPWSPAPVPSARALLADATRCRTRVVVASLGHPLGLARRTAVAIGGTATMLKDRSGAPRTSLNALPQRARRLRVVHLDLNRARGVAHAHCAKVNDVLLAVVTGGLRELLKARGELLPGLELKISVPAALRTAAAARGLGNAVGALLVPVPASEPDAVRRLETIAVATRAAKVVQSPAYVEGLMACLSAVGLSVPLARRQRMINTFVTNVPGPRDPLYLLGATVEEVMPVVGLAGNVTLIFAALSYRGRFDVVVDADRDACPDVDVLVAGMRGAWAGLTSARAA